MQGKNFYAGYLKAMSYMEKASIMVRCLDCLDFKYDGDIHKSIINYLASRYYEFGIPPCEWKKYPNRSYKRVVEETELHLEKVVNWKEELQSFLSKSFPKVYGHRIGEHDGDISEINVLDKYFIGTLEDEIHETLILDEYENIEEEEFVNAYKFANKDYNFLRYCFSWTLIDTFIIIIGIKRYMMYFGFDD